MILSLCIDTLKTHVSFRGYMFFCPCPETNIASIVSGQLFVHVSMVYGSNNSQQWNRMDEKMSLRERHTHLRDMGNQTESIDAT